MTKNPNLGSARGGTIIATDIIPITPNDDNDLPTSVRAIRCKPTNGTAGTLRITTLNGKVRNTEISLGELLLVGVKRVHSSGTDADGLEGLI